MLIQRTIKLKLHPNVQQEAVLLQAAQAYTASFNEVCAFAWEHKQFNGVELHKATYLAHRERFGLPSQLAISARMKATEALTSANARQRKGKPVHCPLSRQCPIRYDQRSYTLCLERQEVSVLTLQGRLKLAFRWTHGHETFSHWKPCCAELIHDRRGRWWLHLVMSEEIEEIPPDERAEACVGVDLGIVTPASDSRGWMYGFEHWKAVELRHARQTSELQSKGTRSAKRKLKRTSGRQRRFRRDCDHVLSKRLVQSVEAGYTLVFEELTGLRERVKLRKAQRKRVHKWSFAQLQTFVSYKAQAAGVHVAFVDPSYTSQRCSQCHHVARSNRPKQAVFHCRECGFSCHADYNAAVNIRTRYLENRGLPVNQPIVAIQELSPFELVTSSGL